jgi:hypothetical protein
MECKDEIINFATWYSGMDRKKVEAAYKRYLVEIKTPKQRCNHANKYGVEGIIFCSDCGTHLGGAC